MEWPPRDWVVRKKETKLTPCSCASVQWKIKFWHVIWPHNVSLWLLNKLRGWFNNPLFLTLNQRPLEGLYGHKISMPNLGTYSNWTPIFEWYVVGVGAKNGYRKDKCLKEIGLCTQNYSRFNNQHEWKNLYDHLMNIRIFTLIMNKIFIWAPRSMNKWPKLFYLNPLTFVTTSHFTI